MSSRRQKGPRLPVGLQQKVHRHTGEAYWAVVALDTMSSGGVRILSPYSEDWQRPRKGSLAVSFVDELEPSAPDLDGLTVHVTRAWLASHFQEPSWEQFEASECRLLGATVGIMTGLLPPEGVPVRVGTSTRGKAAAGGRVSGHRSSSMPGGVVGLALRRMLPFMLLNVVVVLFMWCLPHYLRQRNRTHE